MRNALVKESDLATVRCVKETVRDAAGSLDAKLTDTARTMGKGLALLNEQQEDFDQSLTVLCENFHTTRMMLEEVNTRLVEYIESRTLRGRWKRLRNYVTRQARAFGAYLGAFATELGALDPVYHTHTDECTPSNCDISGEEYAQRRREHAQRVVDKWNTNMAHTGVTLALPNNENSDNGK